MKRILILVLLSLSISTHAQQTEENQHEFYREKPFYAGLGAGMDFGGFGGKFEYMFFDYVGLFGGVGYNFNGLGLNGGMILKPVIKEQATPYLLAMYGYNGVIVILNEEELSKTSYGFTLGGGLEIKTKNLNAWQLGILFPFRSTAFYDHYDEIKKNPDIQIGDLPKIGFSIGFKVLI